MTDVGKLLVLFLLLVGAQSTLCQRGPDRISVQLSMEKNQYVVGKRIRVTVRIQNRSDQPLIVSNVVLNSNNRSGQINFFVTDDQGMTHASKIEYVGDSFAPFPSRLDVVQLISKWTVLYPNSSVTSILDFDSQNFQF